MKSSLKGLLAVAFTVGVLFSGQAAATAADQPTSPATAASAAPSVVMDDAHMLSAADIATLTSDIQRDDTTYGLAFVVETAPSLNGQPIESVALARANALGVGQAGKDNGVFIYIARDDHKVRFELGKGVSAKISDSTITSIISTSVTPRFKEGDYLAGIEGGMSATGMEYTGKDVAPNSNYHSGSSNGGPSVTMVLTVVFGSIGALVAFGLLWGVLDAAKDRRREKERDRLAERLEAVKDVARKIKFSKGKQREEYEALPNELARLGWLGEHYPEIVPVLKALRNNEAPTTRQVDRYLYADHRGISVGSMWRDEDADRAVFHFAMTGEGFEQVSIAEANKRIKAQVERYYQAVAKQQKMEEARKKQAKDVWKNLPDDVKTRMRKARSKREQKEILASANNNIDHTVMYPLIFNMFLNDRGYSSNDGGGYRFGNDSSSGYSSGSSYGSYGGGFDSGSSFGGGGFDGGGGSGSW